MVKKGEKKKRYKRFKTVVNIFFLLTTVFVLSSSLIVFATTAEAQTPQELSAGLGANEQFRQATGLAGTDIRIIIAKIIRAVLGLVGLVMIGFIIYAGYLWMTSAGEEEKITTAKNMLKNLVIGLAIILMSVAIVQFVINSLIGAGGSGGAGEEGASGGQVFFEGHAELGSIVESHYPERDAKDIPRNTIIAITFKEKIRPETIIADQNNHTLNSNNVKIYRKFQSDGKTLNTETAALKNDQVSANVSIDKKNFVFKPGQFLGDPNQDVVYIVVLKEGIKIDDGSKDGKSAFQTGKPYDWSFSVSPKIDLAPPRVTSVLPYPFKDIKDTQPRNLILQINFNEPINPLSASGKVVDDGFKNILVSNKGVAVDGEFKISNGYRTVEFVPNNPCGQNACGQTIYCLPAQSAPLFVTAKSATLEKVGLPTAVLPADGLVDMAANSLDGGGEFKYDQVKKDFVFPLQNGKAEGPPSDNFVWAFNTSNQKDVVSPKLTAVNPNIKQQSIADIAPLEATFDKIITPNSLESFSLKSNNASKYVWFTKGAVNYDGDGVDVNAQDKDGKPKTSKPATHTKVVIQHGKFWIDPPPPAEALNVAYFPFLPSTITDAYQNCFYPAVGPQCIGDKESPSCFDGQKKAYKSAQNCEKNNVKGQIIFDKEAEGCKDWNIIFP